MFYPLLATPTHPMLLAVLLPPLAVYRRAGLRAAFWIACALTVAFYLPGVAFALWYLRKRPARR